VKTLFCICLQQLVYGRRDEPLHVDAGMWFQSTILQLGQHDQSIPEG
jgi:hypothetical protein